MGINKFYKLRGVVKNDHWGCTANESIIPKLSGIKVTDKNQRFSELWIGSHPSRPAEILNEYCSARNLIDLINAYPDEILGKSVSQRYGKRLPFLFKVLSIDRPLSIQVHPDIESARLLHCVDPVNYPDCNHKPEMAIAIKPATLLYGFRGKYEMAEILRQVPELGLVLESCRKSTDDNLCEDFTILSPSLAFKVLLTADIAVVQDACKKLYCRLQGKLLLSPEETWVLSLSKDYPDGDLGVFCFFLQNLQKLESGQAVYIPVRVPHAYLDGEIVECMANSDNVIRVGLTPKYKDLATLLKVVDFNAGRAELVELTKEEEDYLPHYQALVGEFKLCSLQSPVFDWYCPTENRVQLFFSLSGKGMISSNNGQSVGEEHPLNFEPGDCYLIAASTVDYRLSLNSGQIFITTVGG